MVITRIEGQFNFDVVLGPAGTRVLQLTDPSGHVFSIVFDEQAALALAGFLQTPGIPLAPSRLLLPG